MNQVPSMAMRYLAYSTSAAFFRQIICQVFSPPHSRFAKGLVKVVVASFNRQVMNRQLFVALLVGLVMCAFVVEHAEAHGVRLKKLAKAYFIARAFRNKKIYLPLPLPLPIPLFKENVHHEPVPVHHHTKAIVGYGFEGGHGGGMGYY